MGYLEYFYHLPFLRGTLFWVQGKIKKIVQWTGVYKNLVKWRPETKGFCDMLMLNIGFYKKNVWFPSWAVPWCSKYFTHHFKRSRETLYSRAPTGSILCLYPLKVNKRVVPYFLNNLYTCCIWIISYTSVAITECVLVTLLLFYK